jgi:hypothetical protein
LRLSERQQITVAEDVRQRLDSLLRHWHDKAFRRTVLTPGIEEASFYDPFAAALDVRALVVVAVRNSLIEDLAASRPASVTLKLAGPVLTDSEMPSITGAAIRFFQTIDLNNLESVPQNEIASDIFDSLSAKYPHAWNVLSHLGNSSHVEAEFEQVHAPALELSTAQPSGDETSSSARSVVSSVSSGIDPGFDSGLLNYLDSVRKREVPFFFSDSFKGITRNLNKLYWILDYVLGHGAAVVTHNYYLSPTYLSQRRRLLRHFNFQYEMEQKLSNQTGLKKRHQKAIQFVKVNL